MQWFCSESRRIFEGLALANSKKSNTESGQKHCTLRGGDKEAICAQKNLWIDRSVLQIFSRTSYSFVSSQKFGLFVGAVIQMVSYGFWALDSRLSRGSNEAVYIPPKIPFRQARHLIAGIRRDHTDADRFCIDMEKH